MAAQRRRQATRVWMTGLSLVLIWVAAILLAPLARATGLTAISSPLYQFFAYICHQIADRSFYLAGEFFGVCSRCFGVYFGLLAGLAFYPLWRNITEVESPRRIWLFAALVPIVIDWSLTAFGIWENTLVSRLITGLILGFACATFIFPALVETIRNVTRRRVSSAAANAPSDIVN